MDENEADMKSHSSAIDTLAAELDVPLDRVRRLYGIVLERFEKEARIKDFLHVLVSRRVKYLLGLHGKDFDAEA